jgi:very-short-patch-repair endonuclease
METKYIKGHGRKGRKNSAEHNLAISFFNKGKIISSETIEKIRLANIGRICSEEQKVKMRKIAIERGFGKWMKGRMMLPSVKHQLLPRLIGHEVSSETRRKIADKNRGNGNGMYGYHHTNEAKERIKKSSKERWLNSEYRLKMLEKFKSPTRILQCRKAALKAAETLKTMGFLGTKPELIFKSVLDKLKIDYIHGFPVDTIYHCYMADFYLPYYNTIVEIDGTYWHDYPNLRDIDLIRNKELISAGYRLLRIWDININDSESLLKDFIEKKSHTEVLCQN